jgi:hypothetical protein
MWVFAIFLIGGGDAFLESIHSNDASLLGIVAVNHSIPDFPYS